MKKWKKIANSKPYAKKVEPLNEGLIVELKSEAENLSWNSRLKNVYDCS